MRHTENNRVLKKEVQDYMCPFFVKEAGLRDGKYKVYCESCVLKLPDIVARRKYVYRYCAHPVDFKECPIYKVTDDYYNRIYNRKE